MAKRGKMPRGYYGGAMTNSFLKIKGLFGRI